MSEKGRRQEAQPKIARDFESAKQFAAEVEGTGYARYHSKELSKREAKLATMIEGAKDVALFNSGMAAIHSAIAAEGLKTGDIVLCAEAMYSTTQEEIQQLKPFGIRVVLFDSTDMDALQELVRKEKPRLIIAESVANSRKMEVTDLARLGEIAREANTLYQRDLTPEKILERLVKNKEQDQLFSVMDAIREYKEGQNSFIFRWIVREMESTGMKRKDAIREISRIVQRVIRDAREKVSLLIDNTLPSPHLLNPIHAIDAPDVEKVIVESGTKHFQEGTNEITLGVAYSDNAEKIQAMKERRIELGTYLQPSDERKIPKTIEKTMPEIMKNHARNALRLAEAMSTLPGFEVSHPNLPQHKQNDLVRELAPEGAVTLFYMTVPEGMTGEQFMQKVKNIGGESIGLGSSFGHPKTWLSNYGMDARTVRIAVGSELEKDFEEVIEIFRKAAV